MESKHAQALGTSWTDLDRGFNRVSSFRWPLLLNEIVVGVVMEAASRPRSALPQGTAARRETEQSARQNQRHGPQFMRSQRTDTPRQHGARAGRYNVYSDLMPRGERTVGCVPRLMRVM